MKCLESQEDETTLIEDLDFRLWVIPSRIKKNIKSNLKVNASETKADKALSTASQELWCYIP